VSRFARLPGAISGPPQPNLHTHHGARAESRALNLGIKSPKISFAADSQVDAQRGGHRRTKGRSSSNLLAGARTPADTDGLSLHARHAVFKTVCGPSELMFGKPVARRFVQQRRWQTPTFGGTQRHSANSDREFGTGRSDLLTARFRVRIPVPEPNLCTSSADRSQPAFG
jgi:hypothetical protein